MKRSILASLAFCLLFAIPATAQFDPEAEAKKVLAEGLFLYRLEKASWHSSDMITGGKSGADMNAVSGYLSYADSTQTKSIFWDENQKIIYTVTFDTIATATNGVGSTEKREATLFEADLIALRIATYNQLMENKGRFFKFYDNTSPNIIPIIRNGVRSVYILTGTTQRAVLIGNDYLLTMNDKNVITNKIKLHKSLIWLEPAPKDAVRSTHTHIIKNQDLITATDICTFMLNRNLAGDMHIVMSRKYLSTFNAKDGTLVVTPMQY